ncbi:MAG: DNA repair exonuclease [Myxococcales bacterium]|nr:DNA repair exonuclease [Myxococcales bacterium]
MKLVHAADLHIDSPLAGLERYEGAPLAEAREATRHAFRNVVNLCLAEKARFLILAGDVFDGDWRDANTGLFFVHQLARLREIDCRVLLLRGNHDHELTRTLVYRVPEFVHVFGPPDDPSKRSFVFPDDRVAFHGVSYPTRKVDDSLLPHYPRPLPELLNIGVLHTNCTGSTAHDRYAPCTVQELSAFGYGYWALGHVHTHQVLSQRPWIVYPGNTQGRHAREPGPKGCVLVTVDGTDVVDVAFHETGTMRFAHVDVVLGEGDDEEELLRRADAALDPLRQTASERRAVIAVRLTVRGSTALHRVIVREPTRVAQNLRSHWLGRAESIWLEKVIFDTRPLVSLDELRASPGLVGDLMRNLEHLRSGDGEPDLAALAGEVLGPLRKKLRAEADALGLPLHDVPTLAGLVEQVETLLAERLVEREGR